MKEFDFEKIDKKTVRLKLKSGHSLIGTIQKGIDTTTGEELVFIFTIEKQQELRNALGEAVLGKTYIPITTLTQEQIDRYLEYIPLEEIDNVEIIETEIHGINLVTQNGKQIEFYDFQVQLTFLDMPGMVKVHFKIPEHDKMFEIGACGIKNGKVEVPISVAFISYAREDEKAVTKITRTLNDHAVVTWFDQQNLMPGDNWKMRIEQAIEKADYFLLFLSQQTEKNIGYKNKEIQLALEQQSLRPDGKIFVIPILLDDCTPPWELRNLNWLKTNDDRWLEKLIRTIAPWYAK